jgi:hypothetical protein
MGACDYFIDNGGLCPRATVNISCELASTRNPARDQETHARSNLCYQRYTDEPASVAA